jgi:hypothetical protein
MYLEAENTIFFFYCFRESHPSCQHCGDNSHCWSNHGSCLCGNEKKTRKVSNLPPNCHGPLQAPVVKGSTHFLAKSWPGFNPQGILRKYQKVIELTQTWKDIKNNGTTWKLVSNEYQCYGVSIVSWNYQQFLHSDFGDKCGPPISNTHRAVQGVQLTVSLDHKGQVGNTKCCFTQNKMKWSYCYCRAIDLKDNHRHCNI